MASAGEGSSNYELSDLGVHTNNVVTLDQSRRAALATIDNAKFSFVYFWLSLLSSVTNSRTSLPPLLVGSTPKSVLLQALAFSLRRLFIFPHCLP